MKQLCNAHRSHVVIISTLAILALIAIIVQSKGSKNLSNFFYSPSSFWFWSTITNSTSNVNHGAISPSFDPLAHSLAIINNSSSLAKSEEKRQRALNRVRDAIEEVLKWRKNDDEKINDLEMGLARARDLIKNAIQRRNFSSISPLEDVDYVPQGNIYKNAYAFHRSYLLMEKMFKIYIYKEGEPPLFHYGPAKGIYSLEGIFISSLEMNTHLKTHNANEAHVFFLPFSVVMILEYLFDPIVRDKAVLERTVVDYVGVISNKYPFWNRSLGVDHFMLSCHDWGPRATWYHPLLYFHSIRALCNANTSENFNPRKDVSIPEINLETGEFPNLVEESSPSEQRTILAFFAGRMHGHIRPILLEHWKGKDREMQIYEEVPKGVSYNDMMKKSKYCICPSGYEVASPRVVEAIYAECVPVLISQHYIPPFSDVLNWDSFSIQVPIEEISNLKRILMSIPQERYLQLKDGVKRVQRHFVINFPPKRYDVFHMIVHSIWLRRLNVQIHG